MKKIVFIVPILFLLAMLCSCSMMMPQVGLNRPDEPISDYGEIPQAPIIPEYMLTPVEELINSQTIIHKFVKQNLKQGRKIGVMDFTTPERLKGTGNLVADTLSMHFLKNGLNVIERQNISKIIDEQNMRAENRQDLTEEEIAQKIGKIAGADYIVFGAVTQFHFENATLPIPYKIDIDLMKKYHEKLDIYEKKTKSFMENLNNIDKKYYKYIENDIFCQMSQNDVNRGLHYKNSDFQKQSNFFSSPQNTWKGYNSAVNIIIDYPYLSNKPALPFIGVSQRWVENRAKVLKQEIDGWKQSFKSFLESYDKKISQQDYEKAIPSSFINKPNSYQIYKTSGTKDEYIKKVESFAKKVTDKLNKYYYLLYQLKACGLDPIPKTEIQFDIPEPVTRFISVANLGITLKIVNINTGDIVWIGQSSKRDINVQNGLNSMINTVVKEIITGEK